MLFKEACELKDDYFLVLCELTNEVPNAQNIEEIYKYIRLLRTLPKPFYTTLDLRKGPLLYYAIFFPTILKELLILGVSECLELRIILHDTAGIIQFIQRVVKTLRPEEQKIVKIITN